MFANGEAEDVDIEFPTKQEITDDQLPEELEDDEDIEEVELPVKDFEEKE